MSTRFRRHAAGVMVAGGAALAAAMLGAAATPVAHADAIDELLIQAEGDITNAATVFSSIDAALLPAEQAGKIGDEVSALQGLEGLVAQIQSQQDALPEALQSSSQLVGADNQLASASGDVLSAVNAYVNAADAGDYVTGQGATFAGEVTGYFDKLNFVYAEVFQFLPAALNDEFTTVFDGFPNNVEPISVPNALADLGGALDGSSAADLVSGGGSFADLLSSIGL